MCSGLDELSAGVVESLERHVDRALVQKLIYRLSGSCPVTVIINLDYPALADPLIELSQTNPHAVIPVAVDVQDRDLFLRRKRTRFPGTDL